MDSTSISLLQRAVQKNGMPSNRESAWQALADIYQPLIGNWLGRLSAPRSSVDDIVQEVLLVVMKKLAQFEHNGRKGAFRTWLRLIAVNCLRDFRKSKQGVQLLGEHDGLIQELKDLEDPESSLTKQWDREHDIHVTQQLMNRIRPEFEKLSWRAFEMVALEQLSVVEVSKKLGVSTNAIYIAKSRILGRLRIEAADLLDLKEIV